MSYETDDAYNDEPGLLVKALLIAVGTFAVGIVMLPFVWYVLLPYVRLRLLGAV